MSQLVDKIILFDGVCNFCNASVNFIMRRDKKKQFHFAALQSSFGRNELIKHNLDPDALESVVLIDGGNFYMRSTAALHIAKDLSGLWPLFYVFIIIPAFLRDPVYKLIANNRYRWFGKREECRLPTLEERDRFVA